MTHLEEHSFEEETSLVAIPEYPIHALPAQALDLAIGSQKDGLPAALVAGAAIAATAAAVGPKAEIRVHQRWTQRAIFWITLLAPRGAGKSPAQEQAFKPIRDYDEQLEGSEEHPVLYSDTTLEAFYRTLNKTKGAATLELDELSMFLRGMGEYKRGGGGDQGRVLSLWTGRDLRYHRATNDLVIRVPRPTVVVVGGLQTGLHNLLGGDLDGMRPRWLPHLAEMPAIQPPERDRPYSVQWQTLLGGELLPERHTERVWTLDERGYAAFVHFQGMWKRQARGMNETPTVEAALDKADTHLARLALVLAEAEAPARGGAVGSELVERAAEIIEFTLDCWRALPEQASFSLSRRDTVLDEAVERLVAWLESHGGSATRRELLRAHVCGCRTGEALDALIERYEKTHPGCVSRVIPERGGLPQVVVRAPARRTRSRPPLYTVSPEATPLEGGGYSSRGSVDSDGVPPGDTVGGDTVGAGSQNGSERSSRPSIGDFGFQEFLWPLFVAEQITEGEWRQADYAHRLVTMRERSRS
jgi:Protein of unknown function (DUF3987)